MKKIIILTLTIFLLSSCSLFKNETNQNYFVVIPHHSITDKNIDAFYKDISKKYENIENIVLISTNHYLEWTGFFESFKQNWTYCFLENSKENCVKWWTFDFYNYSPSYTKDLADYANPISKNKFITSEHWIWEHFKYINKYFNKFFGGYDKVYSVVLRSEYDDFSKTREVLNNLKNYNFPTWNTLFIASVDFSHHVFEEAAIFHDIKSVEELNKSLFENAEVDCQNCLFLTQTLAKYDSKNIFTLKNRTSSSSIMWQDLKYENTSHVFWEFIAWDTAKKEQIKKENIEFFDKLWKYEIINYSSWSLEQSAWIFAMFFWDSQLTRSFDYEKDYEEVPASYSDKRKYFQCFYQNQDLEKDPKYWKNIMFYSMDLVWVNLETALCEKEDTIYSDKQVKLLTKPEYIKYFKEVWINLFNLANNHSYDYGNTCFDKTKEILKANDLRYFWDGRATESNIYKIEKNGVKLAFIWINDTSYPWSLKSKLDKIKALKQEWYKIILNIHWGLEYKTKNNIRQQELAHSFIDNWVDMIIGHHPHVVENIEIYKNVPIFYSLGNFIFDQNFDETIKWLSIIFRIDDNSLRYSPIYFERNKNDFSIDCESFKSP